MKKCVWFGVLISIFLLIAPLPIRAQSTEFAFQGRLTDAGVPVAVNYDLRFTLFSQSAGGTAIGTVERTNVPVSNGVFTVKLDFGAAAFDGTARWIETEVKPTGGGAYQTLNPRVFLTTVPYSVRSLTAANATQLGGVDATEFVQTTDPRMTDSRPPAPGNGSYIQNTTAAQAASNFSISGNGTAGGTLSGSTVNADTDYKIGGAPVFSVAGIESVFVGVGAGFNNQFSGIANSFFGRGAGNQNTTGDGNSFFGRFTGISNTTGSFNTAIGYNAKPGGNNLTFSTAIGAEAVVTFSNAIQLGRNGVDRVLIGTLGVAGPTAICLNANNTISSCSSSIRYKKNIQDFSSGLDLVRNLRPVSFDWKADNKSDIGLVAEEVAAIEPLLITYNDKGEIEGVKYDRVGVVLVNAVNEQQQFIETLQKTVLEQKQAIEELRKLVCSMRPEDRACRPD